MRQVRVLALMTALLLLVSCSAGGAEKLQSEIREQFETASGVTASAVIRADYGSRVYEYRVRYAGDLDSGTIEILKPAEISGLTAEISDDGCTLIYDGAELETGPLTTGGLSPLEALPLLFTQWREGYVTSAVSENYGGVKSLAVTTRLSDTLEECTWFDADTLLPIRAELYDCGYMAVSCDFENVIIN